MAARDIHIRAAQPADLAELGALGAQLAAAHYEFDARRFLAPGDGMPERYAQFLGEQLEKESAAILVAEVDGRIAGYVYAGVEPVSMHELRDEAGFIHDIVVGEDARRFGVARLLLDAALAWLRGQGMARALLWRSPKNEAAARLFEGAGFRVTMIEMTREL